MRKIKCGFLHRVYLYKWVPVEDIVTLYDYETLGPWLDERPHLQHQTQSSEESSSDVGFQVHHNYANY